MRPAILVTALVVVALAVAVLLGYTAGRPSATPTPTTRPSTSVPPSTSAQPSPTATPRRSQASPSPSATPVDTSVRASAVVVPQRSADLALPISGIVNGVYVSDGDLVDADQILVRLDRTRYLAAIDLAEADVGRAEAAVERAQLQVDQLPPDASTGQIESAQAELRLAEAELDVAQSRLSDAQLAIEDTDLRAPFAGTIAAVNVEVGEQANAGQPLVALGDLTGWLIETTDLSELEVIRIAVGDQATVSFPSLPGLELTGQVESIQVRGSNSGGGVLFAVAIKPDVHHPELRWNASADVRIMPSS